MRLRPVPPILSDIVKTALQVCDRTRYSVNGPCPSCGGSLSGYDTRMKRFATLIDESGESRIAIIIHRSYCRSCGKVLLPELPFYPGTRAGSPVVDLCRAFGKTMTSGRVAAHLGRMGVSVDRWSVQGYIKKPIVDPPVVDAFGYRIPLTIFSLFSLAGNLQESDSAYGEDILMACNHPCGQNR